jgi:hypothetical protein
VRIGEKLRPDIPWSGMFETIKEASFEPYGLTIYFGLEIGSGLISQLVCWAQKLLGLWRLT